MKLTENEKRDAIKLIEAGKPLPDKYRFLLFDSDREVELIWSGKTSEVCNVVLPFQVIEQVDEPRSEDTKKRGHEQLGLFDIDSRGRQLKGWTNKLIWGDNKLILSSLKNGPLREEIEKQGGIKLIYIDPPFDVGADFSMDIEIGGDTFTKKPNVLEELAYRDTWGKGADSFIAMIYERLVLMRDLMAEDGSIYVHCDYRVSAFIKLVLDEIFSSNCFINKKDKKDWRAFEILNLGKYERQHYIGVNPDLREEEKQRQIEAREKHFLELILHAYQAEPLDNFKCFHGKKAGRMVAVGPVNLPVTRLFIEEIILECRQKRISRVDVPAFEFEMGLFPNIQEEAKSKGIDLAMKYIPRDVFDKRAVEKNQVVFHDVSFIEVKPHVKKKAIAMELTDFSVFYSQDSMEQVATALPNGKNKIVVENGRIVKIIKDKKGIVTREVLTRHWTDWIDYWQ